jgi:virulence-associated protein VapD
LNIPVPFSLVSNNVAQDKLVVVPGYWFMYNMYALARNAWKYVDRDRRTEKIQRIEYDFLAPDTINELFNALKVLEKLKPDPKGTAAITGWENTSRKTEVQKIPQAIKIFRELIAYYGTIQLLQYINENKLFDFGTLKKTISAKIQRSEWLNIGGQLVQRSEVEKLKRNIRSGKVKSWEELHDFYKQQGAVYASDKLMHAYTSLLEIKNITPKQFTAETFKKLLQDAVATKEWICKGIFESRAKDYNSSFRKMVYDTNDEMNKVMGRLEDNSFIQQQLGELDEMKKLVKSLLKKLKDKSPA